MAGNLDNNTLNNDSLSEAEKIDDMFNSDELLSLLDEISKQESDLKKAVNQELEDIPVMQTEENVDSEQEWVSGLLSDIQDRPDAEEKMFIPRHIKDFSRDIYSDAQLTEIQKGIEHRLDVDIYSDAKYSGRQMREIRYGLERGLDVSHYINVLFRERQMKEIRIGLQDGLDVTSYARLLYSATDMKEKRMKMYMKEVFPRMDEVSYDYDDPDTGVHIYVEPGLKEAGIVLTKPLPEGFTRQDIHRLMKAYDITYGFAESELPSNLANLPISVKIPVCFASEPVEGQDGYYEFTVPIAENAKPTIKEDGSVDYFTPKSYESIKRGDVVAICHEATKGKTGTNVMGTSLEGRLGKDAEPIDSEDLILSRDKMKYMSKRDGFLNVQNGKVYIMDFLTFDRDVGYMDGRISFDGSIRINGNVADNIEISASGDVIISGYVQGANIVAGRDVVISGGVNSDGSGSIVAGGNVTAAFLESANVEADGSIEVGYILNSEVKCGDVLATKGKKSLICGGHIIAVNGISSAVVGSKSRVATYVEVGGDNDDYEEYGQLKRKLAAAQESIDNVKNVMVQLLKKMGALEARQNESYIKLQQTLDVQEEEQDKLEAAIKELDEKRLLRDKKSISVGRIIYDNTIVCVNGNRMAIKEERKGCIIRAEGRSIKIE